MERLSVTFLPDEQEITVDAGTTVIEAAALAGVELEGPCGGKGTCGKCLIRLYKGLGSSLPDLG